VGKSSLLNALTERRGLARISKTPGRTRSLNFFAVGPRLALVDLPGYGYAKMPHADSKNIARLMAQYLRYRRELIGLVLLIDARRGPQNDDLEIAKQLGAAPGDQDRPHLIVVASKWDKIKNAERGAALHRFKPFGIVPLTCSSRTGEGIEELRRKILDLACWNRTAAPASDQA
jgi:GTP-binding protein